MKITANNHAYIDGANLHKGVASLGTEISYINDQRSHLEFPGKEKAPCRGPTS